MEPITIAHLIGAAIKIGGTYAADKAQPRSFKTITRDEQLRISEIGASFGAKTEAQAQDFNAALAGYTESAVEGTQTGLKARGITDPGVIREAGAKVRSGLSGAYAAARGALARAKINATSQMDTARANYQQNLVAKQYESQLKNYYGSMGLWGALGGLGTSLMGNKGGNKPDASNGKTYEDYAVSAEEASTPFRMQGVKDSAPIMLDPRYNTRGGI